MCRDSKLHHNNEEMTLPFGFSTEPQNYTQSTVGQYIFNPMVFGNDVDGCVGHMMDILLDLVYILTGLRTYQAQNLNHLFGDMQTKYTRLHGNCGYFGPAFKFVSDQLLPYLSKFLGNILMAGVLYAQVVEGIEHIPKI